MPSPMLRMVSSSTLSINTLVSAYPTTDIAIGGTVLPPLLAVPRTPSPDKPLPITPSSTSSSSTSTDGNSPDNRSPWDSTLPSATFQPNLLSTGRAKFKRNHALNELIESERAYASDLALIRDIHLPIALGQEFPIPATQSSVSSTRTLSTVSGSSSSTLLGRPMTREDVRIIFGNISDLAKFANDFFARLEIALGGALPDGEGEDTVGALFIEMIPHLEPLYMFYITRHPAALARLGSLHETSALVAYHAITRALVQQLSHAWDLPTLLTRPVQRLLNYALLLHAIIEETPDSHGDKENLRRAKAMLEEVSRATNEGQQRREIVKEVFAAGKPAELLKKKGLGIVGRVRGGFGVSAPRSISRADSEEAVQIAQMERDIIRIDAFIQQFARETLEWVKSVQALMVSLRGWAEGFGRVIGLGPDVTSLAFDAFLAAVNGQLSSLCTELEAVVREQLLPQLRTLLETIKRPTLLLDTLLALEPHYFTSLQHISSKGRPPLALRAASTAYAALRIQLCAELPAYLKLLNDGVTLCVGQVIQLQARVWRDVRSRWSYLWDALRVEGEMNAGREETERVWRARREETARDLLKLRIISPENITRQVRSPPSPRTVRGAVNAIMNSLEPARTAPEDMTTFSDSISSVHRRRGSNASPPERRLRRRPSAENLHSHPHPPVPPSPHWQPTVSSRWYNAQALYSCRVIHECETPEGVQYFGLPFFRLALDDVYHVLKEAGHPSRHRDLPLLVDEGENCLLLARDGTGELGWLLANFLFPVD
ncbi:hypothetical protein EI94DRAFT_1743910 [Lactarius quietus]|nr:hypothetical protein EI94DRAFT_1743910 [Lactarius quietus]